MNLPIPNMSDPGVVCGCIAKRCHQCVAVSSCNLDNNSHAGMDNRESRGGEYRLAVMKGRRVPVTTGPQDCLSLAQRLLVPQIPQIVLAVPLEQVAADVVLQKAKGLAGG